MNADDFGATKEINEGIKKAIIARKINSVSIMVTKPYFADAVKFLKKHPQVQVGLHFTLTETKEYPNLFSMFFALATGKLSTENVKTKLQAQFFQLKQTGLRITHLDSHQHIHLYPSFFSLFYDFARLNHIPHVRNCSFSIYQLFLVVRLRPTLKQLLIWMLYGVNNFLLRRKKDGYQPVTQYMYDLNWLNKLSLRQFSVLQASLPRGSMEIICHLAATVTKDPLSYGRYRCLRLLLSPSVSTIT